MKPLLILLMLYSTVSMAQTDSMHRDGRWWYTWDHPNARTKVFSPEPYLTNIIRFMYDSTGNYKLDTVWNRTTLSWGGFTQRQITSLCKFKPGYYQVRLEYYRSNLLCLHDTITECHRVIKIPRMVKAKLKELQVVYADKSYIVLAGRKISYEFVDDKVLGIHSQFQTQD
jgi:hypothetical protein